MASRIVNPLPARLKQARTALKISQKELGLRLGMEAGTASARMNHYEKGKHTPDFNTLKAIADELGVPVAYFFCESDKMAELVCIFNQMDSNQQDDLIKLLIAEKNK